jgi:hypothetical protein
MRLKQLKHLQNTQKHLKVIAKACNIQIYFYNIQLKQLQHTYETLETHACNMHIMQYSDKTLTYV